MTPLELADGTQIDTTNGSVINDSPIATVTEEEIEVPTHSASVELVMQTKRRLHDLPAASADMHPVAIVASYKLFGLSETDIAIALDTSVESIQLVQNSDSFKFFFQAITENIDDSQQDLVRDLLSKNATNAANQLLQGLNSEHENIRIGVAKEVLDRTGHSPKQVIEHKHRMENELVINVVDRTEEVPNHAVFDITPIKE